MLCLRQGIKSANDINLTCHKHKKNKHESFLSIFQVFFIGAVANVWRSCGFTIIESFHINHLMVVWNFSNTEFVYKSLKIWYYPKWNTYRGVINWLNYFVDFYFRDSPESRLVQFPGYKKKRVMGIEADNPGNGHPFVQVYLKPFFLR